MNVNPATRFWISVAVMIAIGVIQGSVHLTNVIPLSWIPYAEGWSGIIAFVGTVILTALNGAAPSSVIDPKPVFMKLIGK
jgi:hypothetical protein